MTKPDRVAPADLDEAVKEGVERAEQANELSQDDLDNAAGGIGIAKVYPGMLPTDDSAM